MQTDSEHFLAERRSLTLREIRMRNRAIRIASCIPVTCVLILFLFFPEFWGFASQLMQSKVELPGYTLSLPSTWFVIQQSPPQDIAKHFSWEFGLGNYGVSQSYGYIGTGPARAPSWYWHLRVPLSDWELRTLPYRRSADFEDAYAEYDRPRNIPIASTRQFAIGNETLTCDEYGPTKTRFYFSGYPRVIVACSGTGRLRASFMGQPMHLNAFYQMLAKIKPY